MVYCLVVILSVIIILLCMKIYLLRESANELSEGFAERLETDTNTLIGISDNDKYMSKLANDINIQLGKLREERLRYQQGDRELKNAVTNISHDLRTPLTAICGYLDLLDREEKSPAVERYLNIIAERIESMKELTEELFCYSVVMSSEEMIPTQVDLCSTLENSLLSYYGVFSQRNIIPKINLPQRAVIRNLDLSAVNRIFSNIISNAAKYSDGDFLVELREDGTLIFSNTAKQLNPVMAAKLFERFYTVEASRNSTGLGLSIAKHLIECMNGSIEAKYSDEKLYIILKFPES